MSSSYPSPPRRVRVVTVVDTLDSGGAEKFALLIATRLDPERFESTLCVSRWPPQDSVASTQALEQLDEAGVRFLSLGRRRKADVWGWSRRAPCLRAGG